ncbi:hypothetical protein Tco_0481392, partial [Tanacetum coccineum]
DGPLVQQGKSPPCSTTVQADAVKKWDVPLVQETQDVLGFVGSSFKGLFEPKIMDTVELLCKQLIDVRPEMKGMVDQLKTKVIDSLTTTLKSVVEHVRVVQAEVVNCEMNLVDCPVVEKDVGVVQAEVVNCEMNLVDFPVVEKDVGVVQGEVVNCEMNLVDWPVVEKDVSDPKNLSYRDTHPSLMDHLINACAYVSPPLPFYDCLIVDNFGEPSQHNEKMDFTLEDKEIVNENSDFDKLLKLQMIKESEVNVVKGDGKPILDKVFEGIRRIKKPGIFQQAPYMQKKPTTPQVKNKQKRCNNLEPIEFSLPSPSVADNFEDKLQTFKEVLRRHCKSSPNKVTVPTCIKSFLRNGVGPKQMYKFPWLNYDIVIDEHFWLMRGMPLVFDDLLQTALAYRERMLAYF